MAGAIGRITGIPGVCIATSGPGALNLATGLVTANTEGDPVVTLIGSVSRLMNTKRAHQSMRALDILSPTAKSAVGVDVEDQVAEIVLNAFISVCICKLQGCSCDQHPYGYLRRKVQYPRVSQLGLFSSKVRFCSVEAA